MNEPSTYPRPTPGRYRKKPVAIEAMRWDGGAMAASHVIDWVIANGGTARYVDYDGCYVDYDGYEDPEGEWIETLEHVAIDTLEGTMRADVGDWVIRGVKGEFYPCKPGIFEATYEPADRLAAKETDDGGADRE